MGMKEDRHKHAQAYQDRIYDRMDENCGFKKEKDKEIEKKQLEKTALTVIPVQCTNCKYIPYQCYMGKRRQFGKILSAIHSKQQRCNMRKFLLMFALISLTTVNAHAITAEEFLAKDIETREGSSWARDIYLQELVSKESMDSWLRDQKLAKEVSDSYKADCQTCKGE